MKQLTLLMLLSISCFQAKAQVFCEQYCLTFDDTICLSQLSIDTSTGNIWQIGKPQKSSIIGGLNSDKAIVTDSMNSYPINNHSVFTITNIASYGDIYGIKLFGGRYFVDSDSLNDYGLIEFSPDNGKTWIDLINDTVYSSSITWYSDIPTLTGKSNGWQWFELLLSDNGSVFNMKLGDTIKYRFTFISDSVADTLDGLAYDFICFNDFIEGISETHFTPIKSKIYPNPVVDDFTIAYENDSKGQFELAIYTIQSKMVMSRSAMKGNKVTLNSAKLKGGMYIYKLTNLKEKKRSWGKFVITK